MSFPTYVGRGIFVIMAKKGTDTESVLKLIIDGKQAKTSVKELRDTYYKLNTEIQNMKREDNPALYDQKKKNIQAIARAWKEAGDEIKGNTKNVKNLRGELADMAKQAAAGLGVAGTLAALKQGIQTAILKNAELSDSMAGVQKTTGLTEEQVDKLNEKFKKIDTRTASSELLGLAQVAGKLGYSSAKDVEGFVRAADKIGVALGEDLGGVEDSVRSLGKLVDIFKIKDQFGLEESLMKVGSAINSLGASGSAAEANLVDFTQRLAGIAPAAGMSLADTLGLAATLDELGQSMESGATATGQFIMGLGKDIPKNARIAGMSVEAFTKLLKEDANEALIRVLEGAKTAGGGLEALAKNMGVLEVSGARGVAALGALAENTEMLRRRQKLSREEFEAGTSVIDEFNTVNNTLGANLDKIWNKLGDVWQNSGFRSWMTDLTAAIVDNRNESEKATEEYRRSKAELDKMEGSLSPLIERYDVLSKKGKLNKEEQIELRNIIAELSVQWPIAVSEVDAYGNAIAINTDTLRGNIAMHERYLSVLNKKAIQEAKELKAVKERAAENLREEIRNKKATEFYGTSGTGGGGGSLVTKNLTNDQLKEKIALLQTIEEDVFKLNYEINQMGGNAGKNVDTKAMDAHTKSILENSDAVKKRLAALREEMADPKTSTVRFKELQGWIKQLESELDSLTKKSSSGNILAKDPKKDKTTGKSDAEKAKEEYEKILKEEGLFSAAQLVSQKERNEREIAEERAKYQKRIDAWEEFKKKKGVTEEQKGEADANILTLGAQSDIAVTKLRVKQEQEATKKIEELRTQLANRHETELQKERDRINKYYADLLKNVTGQESETARITAERDKELADAGIREAERLKKEKERLSLEYVDGQKGTISYELASIDAKYKSEISKLKEKFSEELQLTAEFKEALALLDDAHNAEKAAKEAEFQNTIKSAAIGTAEDIANATFSIISNNINAGLDAKISAINKERDRELSSRNLTESQKKAINEKYDKQERAAKLKAWKQQQKADLISAGINTALGVTKALASSPPPLNWINAAAVGIAGAAQIAVIASKKAPEFEKGGILPNGSRHSQGGIDLVDRRQGLLLGNIEGGEPILSRNTYANNREIVDDLLYSSQRRNGARIRLNPRLMDAEYESRRGGNGNKAPIVNVVSPGLDNTEVVDLLRQLVNKDNTGGNIVFPWRQFEDRQDQIARIRSDANA